VRYPRASSNIEVDKKTGKIAVKHVYTGGDISRPPLRSVPDEVIAPYLPRERTPIVESMSLIPVQISSLTLPFEAWIFALHLLTAATLVGSLAMSWIVVFSLRSAATAGATLELNRVATVGSAATVAGIVGTIGFGIWLAILHEEFHPWDGWVIAAIVLWGVATVALPSSTGSRCAQRERWPRSARGRTTPSFWP
jgi:hypothetical protein